MSDLSDIYFDPTIYTLLGSDVYYDVGAFDGDTIRCLRKHSLNHKGLIVAFEPDMESNLKLSNCDETNSSMMVLAPYALSDKRQYVDFNATATPSSSITPDGNGIARCEVLDEIVAALEAPPTLIKISVNGHETEVLRGATETIKRYQPILAVRLDNKPDDLWQIPLLVRSINPDYRLYVRRYAQDCCGALLYVVPAWRCLG